jgi:hypothetical protein
MKNKKVEVFIFSILVLTSILITIHYCAAAPSGWSDDKRLTTSEQNSYNPTVAVNGSNIHVVWDDFRDGNTEIYYKRSTDNGMTWGSDTRLTNDEATSKYPVVVINGRNIHVVWGEHRHGNWDVYYKRSTDNGESWGNDTRLTSEGWNSYRPAVAVNGSNIHVVWMDNRDGNTKIYYKRSTDNGESWGSDTKLTIDEAESFYPKVVVNGSNIHVVWSDERDGNTEIYYKNSNDNGENWGSDTRLTNDEAASINPVVAVNGRNIHVVMTDNRDGNTEIYYKCSTDNGESWGNDTRLTSDGWSSSRPAVVVNGSNIHVVWSDERDGNTEIYYKNSNDNGNNWGSDTRLTNDEVSSNRPAVAVNGGNIHVVWQDDRDGNWEIYYKQGMFNQSLNQPSSPSPGNGTTNVDINKDLTWTCTDPDGDPLTFDIYFGTSPSPPLVITGHISTTYDPGPLANNQSYYWKIIAHDDKGTITEGPIWSFTTATNGGGDEVGPTNNPPAKPTVSGPISGMQNTSYEYTVVSTDLDNDLIQYIFNWGDGNTSATEFTPNGTAANASHSWKAAGIYIIQVKAYDKETESGTSTLTMYIDIAIEYIKDEIKGYLIDNNNDGIFNSFYNNDTGTETAVEQQIDGTYLIDSNDDGNWDYIYNTDDNTLISYSSSIEIEKKEEMEEDNIILYIIISIIIIFLIIIAFAIGKREKA